MTVLFEIRYVEVREEKIKFGLEDGKDGRRKYY